MDIMDVTRSGLKSSLDEATFDLNASLEEPLQEGSLARFTKALQKYSRIIIQLDMLARLQQQIEETNEQPNTTDQTEEG